MTEVKQALLFKDVDVEAVATLLEGNWWTRLWDRTSRPLAAGLLRDLFHEGKKTGALVDLEIKRGREAVRATRADAERIARRIELAIEEMSRDKGNRGYAKFEKPVAVIMSPYQFMQSFGRHDGLGDAMNRTGRKFKTARGDKLEIYTAHGVYGPLVLTEEALAGFSRQAPELDIRLK